MLKFTVKLNGLEKGQNITTDKARRILMKCMMKMEELAIQNAPTDQGGIRLGIGLFPEILADNYVLKSSAPYSASMEYGTKPFWAPIDPLKEWAARKIGDENIGYAVRAKIAKVGIKAHPYMRPAYYEVLNFWYEYYTQAEFAK